MEGPRPRDGRGSRTVVIRVLDALMRDTMASWIGSVPGYLLVGAVATGPALARLCALRSPDVAVVQLRSAEADELALVGMLGELRPAPHVVGLHYELDPAKLLQLHRAGVHRLVSCRFGAAALRSALDEAAPRRTVPRPNGALSGRELEILALISAGCSAVDIADVLELSPHTVVNHTRHIFTKLDVHSRMQAAAEAGRLGLRGDVAGRVRRDAVTGRSGPLRDEASRILAEDRSCTHPPVTVLVEPTDSCWRAVDESATKVVVVERNRHDLVADAVLRGARGVLSAEDVGARLPSVVSLVRAGYLVAVDEVVRELLRGARSAPTPTRLTPRERDILDSIALGHSVRETAKALGVAVKTVQSQQRQLFAKLGVRNRPAALAHARALGLVGT
jgi:DNA-binding NarL/FixJ family response regulator